MRGKVYLVAELFPGNGITPAYAGKSFRLFIAVWLEEDHPRVCGEKSMCTRSPLSGSGSPPRMRGKATAALRLDGANGITPAYAGKSKRCVYDRLSVQDHPRVCGEKTKKIP